MFAHSNVVNTGTKLAFIFSFVSHKKNTPFNTQCDCLPTADKQKSWIRALKGQFTSKSNSHSGLNKSGLFWCFGLSGYGDISSTFVLPLLNIMEPDGTCLAVPKVLKNSTAASLFRNHEPVAQKNSTNLVVGTVFFLLSTNTKKKHAAC